MACGGPGGRRIASNNLELALDMSFSAHDLALEDVRNCFHTYCNPGTFNSRSLLSNVVYTPRCNANRGIFHTGTRSLLQIELHAHLNFVAHSSLLQEPFHTSKYRKHLSTSTDNWRQSQVCLLPLADSAYVVNEMNESSVRRTSCSAPAPPSSSDGTGDIPG